MSRARFTCVLLKFALILVVSSTALANDDVSGQLTPLELFEQRIMPIFKSPEPASCIQCHLSSVDLKDYILPSHEKTFASLRDQGLINLDKPEKSKILTLIRMGDKDLDEGARLIHEKTRVAEYEAFASWIRACSNDPSIRDLPELSLGDRARPERPDEVIRHARKSRVVDSFVRNVWSQRMRCFPCHTPNELDASNPKHKKPMENQKKFVLQYGTDRMHIFQQTPEETMQWLIDRSERTPKGQVPLINLEDPRHSLLVMKPTSKIPPRNADGTFQLPSSQEPMSHMGGLKMHKNDQSYKSIIAWVQDYARVVGNQYVSVDQLPADNWFATKLGFKVMRAPRSWAVGTPVQLFVFAWDDQNESWEREPVAFTQGSVAPRKNVWGVLFLLASKESKLTSDLDRDDAALPPGRYLIKAYVDSKGRLAEEPLAMLGEGEFAGQAEIENAQWREGFRDAEFIRGNQLTLE